MKMSGIKAKKLVSSVIWGIVRYGFLIASCYLLLYPFLYMISGSFRAAIDFHDPTVNWIPKHISTENLAVAWRAMDYGRSLLHTLLDGMIPALLQFCVSAVAAYGMARFRFKGRSVFTVLMFLNLLVPAVMIIIPMYTKLYHFDVFGILGLLSKITGQELRPNLLDSPFAFWLPAALGVGLKGGLFIYIFTQFFKGLPRELEEAAWLDGAGPYRTFMKIIVPSSGSAAITVLSFAVIWNWSDYLLPEMFLTDNYPLSVMLERMPKIVEYEVGTESQAGVLLASCLLFLIPVILFYLLIQKRFTASIVTSGITGT